MAEEGKKISFGFSKSIKKPMLQNAAAQEKKKVDYIECLDDKAIKIVGGEEEKNVPLVIPMTGSKHWHSRIINKVNADIFEPKATEPKINDEPMEGVQVKQEPVDDIPNGNIVNENNVQPMESSEIKTEPDSDKPLTLEEQAAREIVADLHSNKDKNKEQSTLVVPITNNDDDDDDDLEGKEEPTLEEYEKIPIELFGEAMLRGMGWEPGKGIGKNNANAGPQKIPQPRPKGMGLGADKLMIQKPKSKSTKEEELKLKTGCHVKIVAGKHCSNYGKVEGIDDDTDRVIIKLALSGEKISVNEFLVQPVTSKEYTENSKVLNMKKYEEFKNNESSKDKKQKQESSKSSDESTDNYKRERSEKSKKKSKRRHQSSDDDNSLDRKSRRKRDSSNSSEEEQKKSRTKRRDSSVSSEDQKPKKSKKSKKHKSRDSSAERSSRKNRKKDKEREKTRHKKSMYSESSDKTRHKNRRRSRSRSYSPRNRRRDRSPSYSPRR